MGNAAGKMPIRGRGAASAATYCDFLSLDVQFLIVLSIIFMKKRCMQSAGSAFAALADKERALIAGRL